MAAQIQQVQGGGVGVGVAAIRPHRFLIARLFLARVFGSQKMTLLA
jgi:hypothetical protein